MYDFSIKKIALNNIAKYLKLKIKLYSEDKIQFKKML